jgi:methyl-accepting chemotaxis protein
VAEQLNDKNDIINQVIGSSREISDAVAINTEGNRELMAILDATVQHVREINEMMGSFKNAKNKLKQYL